MWDYTKKVKEFFLHPKNVGEIKDPDAVGDVGSIICGDALRLTLKIDGKSNRITDAKFQTFGCASAIASSSALTELIKGRTLDEALIISNQDIAEKLCLSIRTVQGHLGHIFNKLQVGSRTEAVVRALKEGWVTLDDVP